MPCFLAGVCLAETVAALRRVPLVQVSHQQGHLAAAAWSAGRLDLLDRPFLAWHLSGGTTELLHVAPQGWNLACTRIGGTTDISAGQLIDRTGRLLGLPFPSGQEQFFARTESREKTAAFALASVCQAVLAATRHAVSRYPGLPVVFSGGVASNSMLRERMAQFRPVFCPPQYATDNAMGVAVLAWRSLEEANGAADL